MHTYISFPNAALIGLCAIFCLSFFTPPAYAYNPTDSTVYLAADTLPVFTFTVPITASSRSLHLPIWGQSSDPSDTQFGYEFFSDTSPLNLTGGFGFILSDAPIVADEYVLAPGQTATFTIVLIAVPAPEAAPQQVQARLSSLPLYLGTDRVAAPYTPSELANFVSNKVTVR